MYMSGLRDGGHRKIGKYTLINCTMSLNKKNLILIKITQRSILSQSFSIYKKKVLSVHFGM